MQYLVLLRGAPASGKSTFIKEHHLEPYTLSADQIRTQVSSPVLNTEGEFVISQKQDKYVWETLHTMLEKRMQDGCFTIIDATHYKTSLINQYKNLVKRYYYRVYIVDFTDVPYEELIKRNKEREDYKQVPEEVIKKMTTCFTDDTEVKKWCTVIKPEQFEETFALQPLDLTDIYDEIFVFGDIHGCFTAFKNFIDKHPLTDKTCYLFVGDYTDRGLENDKMVQWLLDNYQKKNVVLLKSNHTVHLDHYANDEWDQIRSREFKQTTYKQLEKFDKKDLRMLCRKFIQMSYFQFGLYSYLVTHGGIPSINLTKLAFVPTIQFIKGVGEYSDCDNIDENWSKCHISIYSIHGHRNVKGVKIHNTLMTYNLDSRVEYGEPLRVIKLNKNGEAEEFYEPNPVFVEEKKDTVSSRTISIQSENDIVNMLNHNRDIIKKELGDGYYSFNFSRDVFFKKKWNELTEIARGLFVHLPDSKIVARSYKKFFNLNENKETSLENIYKKVQYPISVYHKYNGYLGLLSYDFVNDDFFIATKSTNQGDYKNWFKQILDEKRYLTDDLKQYLKENGVTFVFEVIDPIHDPHIIEYDFTDVILLDVIYNTFDYKKYTYAGLNITASNFDFDYKSLLHIIKTQDDLESFLEKFDDAYGSSLEGAVFEDANGYMFKYKTSYYKFWKEMRKLKDEFAKGRIPKKIYKDEQWIGFYKFLEKLTPEELSKDIITLRTKWREQNGNN